MENSILYENPTRSINEDLSCKKRKRLTDKSKDISSAGFQRVQLRRALMKAWSDDQKIVLCPHTYLTPTMRPNDECE